MNQYAIIFYLTAKNTEIDKFISFEKREKIYPYY